MIETTEHLPIGSRLALVLYLPPLPTGPAPLPEIAGEARVVWTDPVPARAATAYRCGVEFVTLDPRARRPLVEFIRAHLVPPSR